MVQKALGLVNTGEIYRNLSVPTLYEHAIRKGEARVCKGGPLLVMTGQYTGRSPKDKYIVKDSTTTRKVWWGEHNRAIDSDAYNQLESKIRSYLQGRDVYVQDVYGGADMSCRIPIRIITEKAVHSIFARHMFIKRKMAKFEPEWTVIAAPDLHAEPDLDDTRSEVFVVMNFSKKMVIIGGSWYGGEIKKSIFSLMNYELPLRKVLSMHASANVGKKRDVAVFFGLSGTGKTTLSSDPDRFLIGDDQHGWSDSGIFNIEAGCYAKVIRLSQEAEPQIWDATHRFGAILENVAVNPKTGEIDMDDDLHTENTRASYPLEYIPGAILKGTAGHPKNVIMLTADAFGVMPPLARLTPAQAMYHFISGYTAKLAGTERGIVEPQATFSTCFGAPFMTLHPTVYAKMLGRKIARHDVNCWLINTGWTGGPYGTGYRIKIQHTRAMVSAALNGDLEDVASEPDPIFGVFVPKECPGVPNEILNPRNTWKNKRSYDARARDLAVRFKDNFKQFSREASRDIKKAGPNVR